MSEFIFGKQALHTK